MKPETDNAVREAIAATPLKNGDAIRKLCNAMWAVAHDMTASDQESVEAMALLSGMAMAALIDYATMLDDERVEITQA